jgi:hypothetical protein
MSTEKTEAAMARDEVVKRKGIIHTEELEKNLMIAK